MNKRQKLVQQAFLDNEEEVLERLEKIYGESLSDIEKKAKKLQDDIEELDKLAKLSISDEEREVLLSRKRAKVYQKQYQEALKKQVSEILDKMHTEEFKTVSEYLDKCYEEGFVGTLYDLQGQGLPLAFPIDQEAMIRAVQLDSKISKGLYSRLGEDVSKLKRMIASDVSRGISTGMTFKQIAGQLKAKTNIGYNNAVRIARTEGHRIQCQSAMDACYKAKDIGADVVKQWDSTLDARTRESHVAIDGQIREIDKPFSNGLMFPGDPRGGAAEVINCRCALLQRARKALFEDEDDIETEYIGDISKMTDKQKEMLAKKLNVPLDELEQYNKQIIPINAKDYDDFKKKYNKIWNYENSDLKKEVDERLAKKKSQKTSKKPLTKDEKSGKISSGAITGAYNNKNDPEGLKRKAHAEKYYSSMRNSNKDDIVDAIAKNANIDAKSVSKMYDHLLINKYNLSKGHATFDEDYDIAQSLQRLREGKNIQAHDLLLVKHEALEHDLMNKNKLTYEEAHELANKAFNYQSALEKWLDENEG